MTPVTLTANERHRIGRRWRLPALQREAARACCAVLIFAKQLLIGIDTGGSLRSGRNLGCLPEYKILPGPPPLFFLFSPPPAPGFEWVICRCQPGCAAQYSLLVKEEPFNHNCLPSYTQGEVV